MLHAHSLEFLLDHEYVSSRCVMYMYVRLSHLFILRNVFWTQGLLVQASNMFRANVGKSVLSFLCKVNLTFQTRSVTYVQGQSPEPRVREYFYYIDHQGQVRHLHRVNFIGNIH